MIKFANIPLVIRLDRVFMLDHSHKHWDGVFTIYSECFARNQCIYINDQLEDTSGHH